MNPSVRFGGVTLSSITIAPIRSRAVRRVSGHATNDWVARLETRLRCGAARDSIWAALPWLLQHGAQVVLRALACSLAPPASSVYTDLEYSIGASATRQKVPPLHATTMAVRKATNKVKKQKAAVAARQSVY